MAQKFAAPEAGVASCSWLSAAPECGWLRRSRAREQLCCRCGSRRAGFRCIWSGAAMETRKDPLRIAVTLAAFLAFYLVAHWITDRLLFWGGIVGVGVASLLAALVATWLVLRIYEHQPLSAAGLVVNRASAHNLAVGILGG